MHVMTPEDTITIEDKDFVKRVVEFRKPLSYATEQTKAEFFSN